MHQAGIIHSDIKPQNILIDAMEQPKLIDFDNCKVPKNTNVHNSDSPLVPTKIGFTSIYSPFELFAKNQSISFKSDVYSFGVTMLEILGKMNVSDSKSPSQLRDSFKNQTFKTHGFKELVSKCIEEDSAKRFSAYDALRHEFWTPGQYTISSLIPSRWSQVTCEFY